MLRLVITKTVGGTPTDYDVDLYENAPVNLRFQFSDVGQINNPLASYSQTFRVPLSKQNTFLFGPINIVELQTTQATTNPLNLQERIPAQLLRGGTPIVSGFIQVKAAYQTKEIYGEVELVFFSGALDLKSELEGLFLSDLNLSSYDHDVTWSNLGPLANAPAGIEYGIMDRGRNYASPSNPIGEQSNPIRITEMVPFLQAKRILEKIIEEAGFTFESTYLNSTDFGNVFLALYNGSEAILEDTNIPENIRVGKASHQAFTADTSPATGKIELSENADDATDPSNNWSNTTDEFTAPFNGMFRIRFTYSFERSGFWTGYRPSISFQKNGSDVYSWSVDFANKHNQVEEHTLFLQQNDVVRVFLTNNMTGGGPSTIIILGNNETLTGTRTVLEVEDVSKAGDYEMSVSANMPEMLQFDFLSSLQSMYNLVFVPDLHKPNHLIIDTFDNYAYSGTSERWSDKIDYSKDVKITPTTDIQKLEYEWSHAPGKDFISEEVQRSLDRVYGRYRVVQTDNDFATGSLQLTTKFAPYLVSAVPGSSIYIHRSLTSDGAGVQNAPPMLAYKNTLGGSPYGLLYFLDEDNNTQPSTSTTFFSMYERGIQTTVDSKDLSFGVERPLFPIPVNPRDTLFVRFWGEYVAELYSPSARIVECYVHFDERDIARFNFANTIKIKGSEYRLLECSFDASQESVAKVKLIAKLDGISLCGELPTSLIASSNTILFNNSVPAIPDYGNQNCCEFYGYVWDNNKGGTPQCRPNVFTLEL
jgi:hypothetical protein